MTQIFTLGDIARQRGIPLWKVRIPFQLGLLPEPQRIGGKRVVTLDELPALEQVLIQRGYLPASTQPLAPAMAG